jgi:hypothetical protein
MFMSPACWAGMAPDRNSLANQMDRVIMLVDLAWRLSPVACAHLAHTFFQVAKMHQAAASAQRAELRIMNGGNPE